MADDDKTATRRETEARGGADVHTPETTPDQERGERRDTGKAIAQGGKSGGHVPGADPDRT